MARQVALAYCVDLPVNREMDGEARLLPGGPPLRHHRQLLSPSQQRSGRWRQMVRDPELYAKGAVRHPDHNTIVLHGWHRVLMNTEGESKAMRNVAFLD